MPRFKVTTRVAGTNEYVLRADNMKAAEDALLDRLDDDDIAPKAKTREQEYVIECVEIPE